MDVILFSALLSFAEVLPKVRCTQAHAHKHTHTSTQYLDALFQGSSHPHTEVPFTPLHPPTDSSSCLSPSFSSPEERQVRGELEVGREGVGECQGGVGVAVGLGARAWAWMLAGRVGLNLGAGSGLPLSFLFTLLGDGFESICTHGPGAMGCGPLMEPRRRAFIQAKAGQNKGSIHGWYVAHNTKH